MPYFLSKLTALRRASSFSIQFSYSKFLSSKAYSYNLILLSL
nr:MAG TPA: hypothetical protein [Caudoviricetes sp.]